MMTMMGCNSSMAINKVSEDVTNGVVRIAPNGMNPTDIVQEFVRLDELIGKLEATCPGPRMATAEAWVEHLQGKINAIQGIDNATDNKLLNKQQQQQQQTELSVVDTELQLEQLEHFEAMNGAVGKTTNTTTTIPGAISMKTIGQHHNANNGQIPNGASEVVIASRNNNNINSKPINTPTQDLANLALNLGVVSDVRKASTHEDFFANLSESALQTTVIQYYSEVLEHTKVRLKTLLDSFSELNELYINHDGIIALISGGTYMTRLEESLDAQLETARDIRDKLGSALEQWRICGLLLRACSTSATLALQQWRSLGTMVNPKDKIHNALLCRSSLQASLVSLDCAQLSLPHVEIKHISNRQILAVKHCNTYMITDIADKARYEHTSKVFVAYEGNMSKASAWLYETFSKTLRKDFDKAEETVRSLAKTLREHREQIFKAARSS